MPFRINKFMLECNRWSRCRDVLQVMCFKAVRGSCEIGGCTKYKKPCAWFVHEFVKSPVRSRCEQL